jgi:hypothetical protein
MDGLMILIAIIGLLSAFGIAAQIWGVDSRDRSLDPRYPVRETTIAV